MTQNNVIQFRPRKTESENGTPVNQSTIETTDANKTTENSLSPDSGFNIQKFLPKGRPVRMSEEGSGFHQIPHKVFEFIIKATDSRAETAVFACLIRYSLGFHRSTCKASHTFIAEWIGLSIASVRRGIDGLIEKELIQSKGVGHSWNSSTVYEIPVIKAYLASLETPTEITNDSQSNSKTTSQTQEKSPESQENGCRQEAGVCREVAQNYADSRHSTVPPHGTKKENSNNNSNKTLSPEKPGESNLNKNQNAVDAYFASLYSKGKQISERKHYDSFKYFYKTEDIEYLLKYLQTKGLPGTGEPVHSPMAHLVKSISNLMPIVLAERDRIQKRQQREKEEVDLKQRMAQEEAEAEAKDEVTFIEAVGIFHKDFPTVELQQKAIQDFAERFPMFRDNAFALRDATIREWAANRRKSPTNSKS